MSPKLLVFAPCERVVIGSEDDNTATLVALLQGFVIEAVEGAVEKQPDSDKSPVSLPAMPFTWYVFALWENPFDKREYRQKFELLSPSNRVITVQEASLPFSDKRFQRWIIKHAGFPLDGPGDYVARLSVKIGDEDFVERASYPVSVEAGLVK